MSTATAISRRQVIALSLGLLGLVSSRHSLAVLLDAYREDWIDLLAEGLDRTAVGQLAKEFLQQNPVENPTRETMLSLLLTGYEDQVGIGAFLRNKVRDDFTHNRVVNLLGWRLSVTEGRILVLLSTVLGTVS